MNVWLFNWYIWYIYSATCIAFYGTHTVCGWSGHVFKCIHLSEAVEVCSLVSVRALFSLRRSFEIESYSMIYHTEMSSIFWFLISRPHRNTCISGVCAWGSLQKVEPNRYSTDKSVKVKQAFPQAAVHLRKPETRYFLT